MAESSITHEAAVQFITGTWVCWSQWHTNAKRNSKTTVRPSRALYCTSKRTLSRVHVSTQNAGGGLDTHTRKRTSRWIQVGQVTSSGSHSTTGTSHVTWGSREGTRAELVVVRHVCTLSAIFKGVCITLFHSFHLILCVCVCPSATITCKSSSAAAVGGSGVLDFTQSLKSMRQTDAAVCTKLIKITYCIIQWASASLNGKLQTETRWKKNKNNKAASQTAHKKPPQRHRTDKQSGEKEINDEVGANHESPNQTLTCEEGVKTCAYHLKGITRWTENTEAGGGSR